MPFKCVKKFFCTVLGKLPCSAYLRCSVIVTSFYGHMFMYLKFLWSVQKKAVRKKKSGELGSFVCTEVSSCGTLKSKWR